MTYEKMYEDEKNNLNKIFDNNSFKIEHVDSIEKA